VTLREADIAAFYRDAYAPSADAEVYGRWRALSAIAKADHVVALAATIGLSSPRVVADVGCGDGSVLAELGRRGFGSRRVGFEIAAAAVEMAAGRSEIAEAAVFDGEHVPAADGAYDLAYASHVLEHVPSPGRLLREMMRVARAVVIEVPLERNLSARRPAARAASEAAGHIQRFDRWRGQFSKTRSEDYHDAEHFISPLHRLLTDNTRERNRIAWPMYTLLCTHVATFEDDVSPARPLADLITRGVFPFALPGNAVLLILDSCADAVLHSSDPAGNRFLHVLARSPDDLATRTVYADYLEHRGDSARADAIRVGALGPPRAAQPVRIFPEGASLLIYRDEDHPPIRDVAAEPPHAYLELGDRLYPLGVATAITYDNDKLAIGPLVDPARGVQLIHADGAIWISVHEARPDVSINGCLFGRLRAARPLFDGEVLDVRGPHDAITAIVRLGR